MLIFNIIPTEKKSNLLFIIFLEKIQDKIIFYRQNSGFYYRVFSNVEKLWLCNELNISTYKGPSYNYRKIGDEFLNKIYQNNLKKLVIDSGYTLFKELEIVSKSPNLTEVDLSTLIKNENDKAIPIEEIMVLFPQIKTFKISPSHFTKQSFVKLSKFKFSNKFQKLRFGMIKTEFDPITFCKFLQDNFDDDADLSLTFHWDFPQLENQLILRVKKLSMEGKRKNQNIFFVEYLFLVFGLLSYY